MDIREVLAPANEAAIAHDLRVSVHTVRKWRQGARLPRPHHARALIDWSRGALTMDDIFGDRKAA